MTGKKVLKLNLLTMKRLYSKLMQKEIEAGSWKVIAEARESGNVGLYRSGGEVRSDLIEEILTNIGIWTFLSSLYS